jgi:hypothetical protein
MSMGPIGKKPRSVPSTSKTSTSGVSSSPSSNGVDKTKTQPTSKKSQPKVRQDTSGKAKMDSSVDTKDPMSKLSSGSKMERAKRGTGGETVKPRLRSKKPGETQKTSTSGKDIETRKSTRTETSRKRHKGYRPNRSQDDGQKVQGAMSQSLKGIKSSRQPQGTKEEQLARLSSKEGKTGGDSVELRDRKDGLEMKRMGRTHRKEERDQPSRMVEVDGKQIEVKDKVWQGGGTATHYMNEDEKKRHEIQFRTMQDSKGQTKVSMGDRHHEEVPFPLGLDPGRRMFVMDGEGKFYSAQNTKREVDGTRVDTHHSSFLRGEKVSGAGGLTINKEGAITKIDDGSGHYKPGAKQTLQAMRELESKGVAMDNVQFEMVRGIQDGTEKRTTGMVNEYRQGGGSETTFQARHQVTDELKQKMHLVRKELDKQGEERAQRITPRPQEKTQPQPQQKTEPQPQNNEIRQSNTGGPPTTDRPYVGMKDPEPPPPTTDRPYVGMKDPEPPPPTTDRPYVGMKDPEPPPPTNDRPYVGMKDPEPPTNDRPYVGMK